MIRSFVIILLVAVLGLDVYSQSLKVQELDLGGKGSNDMSPILKDSILYFSSDRKSSWLINYYDQNKRNLYRIYQVPLIEDGSFGKVTAYDLEELSPYSTPCIMFSRDGEDIFITKTPYNTYRQSRAKFRFGSTFGIYSAPLKKTGFGRLSDLNVNKKKSNVGQPSITPDGNTLFFVADNKDGYGKSDIWVAEKINGKWDNVQNLGSAVNTEENEVTPFYHPSGKLLFASEGHGGKGGMDIYFTIKTEKGWSKPIPYDQKINTASNDFGCYLSDDESWGVFTSDRSGKNDKLFRFDVEFPEFQTCEEQTEDSYCFTLFENGPDQSTSKPIVYTWDFGDGEFANGANVDHCFAGPGAYHIKLDAVDTLTHEKLFTVAEYDVDLQRSEQVYISSKDTVKVGQPVVFDVSDSYLGNLKTQGFYWEFEDGSRQKGAVVNHVFKNVGKFSVNCGMVSEGFPEVKKCSSKEIIVIE